MIRCPFVLKRKIAKMGGQGQLLFLTLEAKPAFNLFCDYDKANHFGWDKSERIKIGAEGARRASGQESAGQGEEFDPLTHPTSHQI